MKNGNFLWGFASAVMAMAVLFGGYSYVSQKGIPEGKIITLDQDGPSEQTIEARLGDTIQVKRRNLRSAGYDFDQPAFDSTRLSLLSHNVEGSGTQMPGNSGVDVWSFRVIAIGSSDIVVTATRPWEGGETTTPLRVHVTGSK